MKPGDEWVGRKVMRRADEMRGVVTSLDFYDPRDYHDITITWDDGTVEKTISSNTPYDFDFGGRWPEKKNNGDQP